MSDCLQTTVTVLSLIISAVAATLFLRLEKSRSQGQKFADDTKSVSINGALPPILGFILPRPCSLENWC